jgi:hypothetical protein
MKKSKISAKRGSGIDGQYLGQIAEGVIDIEFSA